MARVTHLLHLRQEHRGHSTGLSNIFAPCPLVVTLPTTHNAKTGDRRIA